MAHAYSYRTVDLKTNAVLEDIDLQQVRFSTVLNGVGELDGKVFVPETKKGLLLDTATTPGRTGIYVLRHDVPVWGGIIWKRSWDEEDATFTIRAESWESYVYHRLQRRTVAYTNTDQLTIARDLITVGDNEITSHTQIEPPQQELSGMLRERKMYFYEYKTIGDELDRLAKLEKGFDYMVENYVKSTGELGRRYVFGNKRLGRSASVNDPTSLTFDYPGNLQPFTLTEDAESSAWQVIGVGAGEGSPMLTRIATNLNYNLAGWPMLQKSVAWKDVSIGSTLDAHTNRLLADSLPMTDTWSFRLVPDMAFGAARTKTIHGINIGDSAVFRLKSRRWAEPLVFVRRIVEINVTPEASGIEEVEIGLGDEVI